VGECLEASPFPYFERGTMKTNKQLLSPEDVARIRIKYPVSEKIKKVKSRIKTCKEETIPEIKATHEYGRQEYGPLTEAIESGSVKRCRVCRLREANDSRKIYCNSCETLRVLVSREAHPKKWILTRVKHRAKKRGIPCTLTEKDIPRFPKFCPVFPWIELVYRVGSGRSEGSVSLDRIDNTKGYVPGNVRIISDRANGLKADASDRELIALGKDAQSRMKGNQ
jgi:hypothetical protein